MSDRLERWLVGVGSSVSAALSRAPWWAVVLGAVAIVALTYGIVYVLSRNPRVTSITTFLITVEAEPEEPPPKVA